MRAGFLFIIIAFLASLGYAVWHLWRITPGGWPVRLTVTGIVAIILVSGGIHYLHKQREELIIHTDKPLEKPLTVVLASDLHVGYGNRRAELARWIDLINAEHPDLVLFGGDIVDMHLRPILEGGYADEFRRLEATAFAVLGNHEYFGTRRVPNGSMPMLG